jgi:dTDP-4-dehydrorhamnose 3,5-epimerase
MGPLMMMGSLPAGAKLVALQQIPDERGSIMHMLREQDGCMGTVGEIYFSQIHVGKVKAWKRNKSMNQRVSVPVGKARFVLYDDRPETRVPQLFMVDLGEDCHGLLVIPSGVWYGFQGLSQTSALVVAAPDQPHSPADAEKRDADTDLIPHVW